MIYSLPLTPEQYEELQEAIRMPGFKHITDSILTSVNERATRLIDWPWALDNNGEYTKKSILEYKTTQMELAMLKSFLTLIREGGTLMEEVEGREVFEV